MLKVETKGTGASRTFVFGERVVVGDDGALIGEAGNQSGSLLANAGKVLTVTEAEALGVAAQLDEASKPKAKAKAKAEVKAEPEPKPRRRGRSRKKDK
jgi:hypothetical protein|tara:strand:- start:4817 stop:5110 length:294 start_codon:yes stop_codon:yes gene_type:complete